MSGIVLAHAGSEEEIDKILSQDAYYPDFAKYELHIFQANIISEELINYNGK